MKQSHKIALGIAASLGLGLGAATLSLAHPGGFGPGGMGPGMDPAMKGGMGPGAMMRGGFAGPMAGQQLMTAEERTALFEKMQNAKTPEVRQKLAEANRAEMEKRAKEKGITLPQPHGPGSGFGPHFGPGAK